MLEERAFEKFADLHFHEVRHLRIDLVDFCENREALLDAEQRTDVEMLARLRHDGSTGRDHKHDEIDSADTRKHVLDETLMTGNIDETDGCGCVQSQVGKSNIN